MAFDYFPTDELRRRQMLNPGFSQMPLGDEPDQSVMDEDEQDGDPTASVKPSNAMGLTDAQKRYQSVSSSMPKPGDYKPSILRRLGAGLAGMGAGWRDPKAGIEIASGINRAPYEQAMGNWNSQMTGAKTGLELDEVQQKQDIARQRAASYDVSAQARLKSAEATEAWRQYQQAHMPWQPTNQQEAADFEKLKHPAPKPSEYQEYLNDPEKYTQFLGAKRPPSTALTFEQRQQLSKGDHDAAMERARLHESAATGRAKARPTALPKVQSPDAQFKAEKMAAIQASRDPQYAAFVKPDGTIKGVEELPKAHFWNGTSATDEAASRLMYQKFLAEVARRKKIILGQGGTSSWDIVDDDDNEPDNDEDDGGNQ